MDLRKIAAAAAAAIMAAGVCTGTITGTEDHSPAAITAEAAGSVLPAPSGFRYERTSNSIKLSWNAVKGADMYRVYIYNTETKKYAKYKDTKSPSCTVTGLEANTSYRFRVTSYDKDGNGKYTKGKSSKAITLTTLKKEKHLKFTAKKSSLRSYCDDYTDTFSEPSKEDGKLLDSAKDCLKVYDRYNEFLDPKQWNRENGDPRLVIEDYLDESGNAQPKLKWVYEDDFNRDGHSETLLAVSTAVEYVSVGDKNEFLIYINDSGKAVPIMQECDIHTVGELDYGSFKHIYIGVGYNNMSTATYIFEFDGKSFTQKLYDQFAYLYPDEKTGRIYSAVQGRCYTCYRLNSTSLEYEEFELSQEEREAAEKVIFNEW